MDFVLRGVDSDTLYTLLYFDSDSPFIWMSTGVSLRVVSGEHMISKKKKTRQILQGLNSSQRYDYTDSHEMMSAEVHNKAQE